MKAFGLVSGLLLFNALYSMENDDNYREYYRAQALKKIAHYIESKATTALVELFEDHKLGYLELLDFAWLQKSLEKEPLYDPDKKLENLVRARIALETVVLSTVYN